MKSQNLRSFVSRGTITAILLLSLLLPNVAVLQAFASGPPRGSETIETTIITDLTQLGRNGRLRVNPSFDKDASRLIDALVKGGSRQPILLDELGQIQDLVVEQAALRIASNNVPAELRGRSLVKLEANT